MLTAHYRRLIDDIQTAWPVVQHRNRQSMPVAVRTVTTCGLAPRSTLHRHHIEPGGENRAARPSVATANRPKRVPRIRRRRSLTLHDSKLFEMRAGEPEFIREA